MEVHRSALVEHSAENMFDLIERAEHYPEFLPWCASSTIVERDDAIVAARIGVAWHGVRFEITTRNPKKRPDWLSVRMQQGPFRRFDGDWRLKALAPWACKVEFTLHCEFDNAMFRTVASGVLERVTEKFVEAFVTRANALYGSTSRDTYRAAPGSDSQDRSPVGR